jgi:hypothetical protein
MRIGIVDPCKNLPGPLDIEIAALLDLIGAPSGYAGLTVNNKQAAAPFVAARQTMPWLHMRGRKGKRNCEGSRYGSSDHLVIRCEAANSRAAGHCWIRPERLSKQVLRSVVTFKIMLLVDQVGFLA